jgi:hypothetical protein
MGYTLSWSQLPFSRFTYVAVLKVLSDIGLKYRVESWGFVVGTGDDCVAIERVPTQMTYAKIDRENKDLMKTLIVMVEFGAAEDLDHDDADMTAFQEALREVDAVHPLGTYGVQKAYFAGLNRA